MTEQVPSDPMATPKTDVVARYIRNEHGDWVDTVPVDFARAQELQIAKLQMLLETSLKFLRPDPSRVAVVTAHGLTRVQLCEAIEEALAS